MGSYETRVLNYTSDLNVCTKSGDYSSSSGHHRDCYKMYLLEVERVKQETLQKLHGWLSFVSSPSREGITTSHSSCSHFLNVEPCKSSRTEV